ncbi:hypothetical protein AB0O58_15150 [Rhodococcus sp. NPDC080181]|uniref:hypothetical protein n=1 Tax=Rhodococcus sp. NPDC080181 TaxID=3155292 RepID=UPI00344D36DB
MIHAPQEAASDRLALTTERDRWSAHAYARYRELTGRIDWPRPDGCLSYGGSFTQRVEVPAWLREVTAGSLTTPESPDLCVARVHDPIDWPTLLAAYPGDLELVVNEGNPELSLT